MKQLSLESGGGRIRTYDLRVMSPTSYQLLHPAMSIDSQYKDFNQPMSMVVFTFFLLFLERLYTRVISFDFSFVTAPANHYLHG